ncbi:MAG TPA: hypothetical protein VLI54_01040 [Bacillota bacterium]|nr:hypothetical protein [Bacillota bacterium]
MNKREDGFSALHVVLVVVFVGVLAAGGWLLFKGPQAPDSQVTTHTASSGTGAKQSPAQHSTAGGASIAPGDQYLTIPEWGIKLKMEDADKVTYVMHGTPNGSPNAEMVTSYASLRLKDGLTSSEACKDLGIALTQLTDAPYSVKIGNYYYGYEGAPGACADSTIEPLRTKIVGTEINTGAMSAL